ncbi:hypothetical protein J1605_008213, partial [Eschrichtius robustus]
GKAHESRVNLFSTNLFPPFFLKLALSLHKFRNYPEKCGGGTAPFLTLLLRVALSRLNLPGYCLKCPNQDKFHEIHQRFCSCPSFHQEEVRSADAPPPPPPASFIQSPHRGLPRLAARPEQPLRQAYPPPPPGLVFPSCGGWAWGWGARRVGAQLGPEKSPRLWWDLELSREVAGARR